MVVDHERAWLRLKAELLLKPAHGQKDLLQLMSRLEVECEVPEHLEGYDARPMPGSSKADDRGARVLTGRA